ncbi:HrpB1 family type III secretion system apparatus protein [Variovorax sp. 770b2]|uniref:HrpB1 family type III secretion system apparatus protein n=1 Tax=Variovorax sp. 770b2 TaxID=1566271 RepID=UPI0008E0E3E0|nr:HrpB1 family type III secretion system apparatus protein [Variovorax sp. 770b2]SFQ04387.1 type III secretion protein (HrpB1_HrpK) [Variovorax sp. 770b2]
MNSASADQQLVDALVGVFYVGIELEVSEHTLPVLRGIRKLRPGLPLLAVAEAQQLSECNDLQSARVLLEETDAKNPDTPIVKAVLAFVLRQQRNGLWQAYVKEARELPADEKANAILDCLDRLERGDPFEVSKVEAPEDCSPFAMSHYMGTRC